MSTVVLFPGRFVGHAQCQPRTSEPAGFGRQRVVKVRDALLSFCDQIQLHDTDLRRQVVAAGITQVENGATCASAIEYGKTLASKLRPDSP